MKAVEGKVAFINMAIDVSPRCDCVNFADMPITPHLGVYASYDPVAIDMACLEAARNAHGMPGSAAEDYDMHHPGDYKFENISALFHGLSEEAQINTGALIGMGSREYELVDVTPQRAIDHIFHFDKRASRVRFGEKFKKFMPFPYDRYDGKGFNRAEEVDVEFVKRWHGDGHGNGTSTEANQAEEAARGD
jgi:hypothetical protein